MQRKLFLLCAGIFLFLSTGNAQIVLPKLFPVAPVPEAKKEMTVPAAPAEWRKDSTWAWHWNSTTSAWQKIERTLRTSNGCGQPVNRLTLSWNYTLSEWVNFTKASNDYFPDNMTPSSSFEMHWNPSDNIWMEVYHALYKSNGDITEWEEKYYDETTNSYTSGNQGMYTYYSQGIQVVQKNLDVTTLSWKNYSRLTTGFDLQGNSVSRIIELWDEPTSSWCNVQAEVATYNAQNQVVEVLYSGWDSGISDWKNLGKITYEYNASGWLVKNFMYQWDEITLSWQNAVRIDYHYDENGNKIQAGSYEWDEVALLWEPDQKELYSYHSNGIPWQTFRYIWIPSLSEFKETEYTAYNEAGSEMEHYSKDINMSTFEYYQGYRTLNTYSEDLLTETLNQQLEVPANTWNDEYRTSYTWDANHNLTQELYESYDDALLAWKNSSKKDHFYSSYIGLEEPGELSTLCYFRNPLSPGETVHCPGLVSGEQYRFRLYTMTGQSVCDQQVQGTGSFTIPGSLSQGSYMLMITGSQGNAYSGRVMIK